MFMKLPQCIKFGMVGTSSLEVYVICNNNINNNHLYFTRVTQSNTRFDFRCGPQI